MKKKEKAFRIGWMTWKPSFWSILWWFCHCFLFVVFLFLETLHIFFFNLWGACYHETWVCVFRYCLRHLSIKNNLTDKICNYQNGILLFMTFVQHNQIVEWLSVSRFKETDWFVLILSFRCWTRPNQIIGRSFMRLIYYPNFFDINEIWL